MPTMAFEEEFWALDERRMECWQGERHRRDSGRDARLVRDRGASDPRVLEEGKTAGSAVSGDVGEEVESLRRAGPHASRSSRSTDRRDVYFVFTA
jgi:hypothetical protein